MLDILATFSICGSIIILFLRILHIEKNIEELIAKTKDIKELRQNIMEVNHKYDEKLRQIYYYLKDHKHD